MIQKLAIKKLDWYIIKKFLGTYIYSLTIIISISVVFDFSEKIDDFMEGNAPTRAIIFDYYFTFVPYFSVLFSSMFTFIAVIFFTSRMAYQSEIIAILSAGVSFRRIMYPYMISAFVIALFTFTMSNFVIPNTNKVKLDFEAKYFEKQDNYYTYSNIHKQVRSGIYIYLDNYSSYSKTGNNLWIEKYEGSRLVSKLIANKVSWDSTKRKWHVENYYIRDINNFKEKLNVGASIDTNLFITPSDFLKKDNRPEIMDYYELNAHIKKLTLQGSEILVDYQLEKYRRGSSAFAIFILTIIGLTLSCRKVRGGMGLHIGLGLMLTFSYILFDKFTSQFAVSGSLTPLFAVWLPNIVYLFIAYYLYRIAPK